MFVYAFIAFGFETRTVSLLIYRTGEKSRAYVLRPQYSMARLIIIIYGVAILAALLQIFQSFIVIGTADTHRNNALLKLPCLIAVLHARRRCNKNAR